MIDRETDFKQQLPDRDPAETEDWVDSLDSIVRTEGVDRAQFVLYRLLKRARQLDIGLPALTQTLDALRVELDGPGLGIREEGRLVAAVRWTLDGDIAHIGRLTVAPDQQGRGLGTRLLREAEAASGASVFELFTGHLSVANIRLYEREGYAEFRREQLQPGVELVFLRKSPPAH
jgi:ribosomal protein S18 acetylase RimI-like enzyme